MTKLTYLASRFEKLAQVTQSQQPIKPTDNDLLTIQDRKDLYTLCAFAAKIQEDINKTYGSQDTGSKEEYYFFDGLKNNPNFKITYGQAKKMANALKTTVSQNGSMVIDLANKFLSK